MNKSVLAGVILLIIGGGAAAGINIADNKIESLYASDKIGILQNFETSQAEFGLTGGTVEWTADIIPDPCQPATKITLAGSDTISKGITGYTINTELSTLANDEQLADFLNQLPKIQIATNVNWLGGGHSEFKFPKHELSSGDLVLGWSDFTGDISFGKVGDDIAARDLNFNLDTVSFRGEGIDSRLNHLNYKSDIAASFIIGSGNADLTIGSFTVNNSNNGDMLKLEEMSYAYEQNLKDDTLSFNQAFKIDAVKLESGEANVTYDDTVLNFDVHGLNLTAMNDILATLRKSSDQCLTMDQIVQEITSPTLDILQTGLKVESQGNRIQVGDGLATANLNLTIPEATYTSIEDALTRIMSEAKYDASLEVDKAFIKGVGDIGSDSSDIISGSIDEDWQNFLALTNAEVEGDKAIIYKSN